MKKCPFCAEEIQDAAVVCRHCGKALTRRSSPLAVGCFSIVAVFAVLILIGALTSRNTPRTGSTGQPSRASLLELDARINFDGTKFTVTNQGKTDWLAVRCTLNRAGFFGDGYEYRVKRLDAGESFKVGAMQFAKPDGTRFNPFQIKPTSMAISAKIDTLSGPEGFYHGQWQ